MDKKHFHRRYGEISAARRPSFAYYNTDNCMPVQIILAMNV